MYKLPILHPTVKEAAKIVPLSSSPTEIVPAASMVDIYIYIYIYTEANMFLQINMTGTCIH